MNDVSEFESFGLITNSVVKSFKIMSINITNIRGYIGYDVIDIYILYANKRSVKYRPLGGYEILKFARVNLLSQRAVASSRS